MKKLYQHKLAFAAIIVVSLLMWSCVKPAATYDSAAHLQTEVPIIQSYIADNGLTNVVKDDATDVFYEIENPGVEPDSGKYIYKTNTQITVKYTGKLLGSTTNFDSQESLKFPLVQFIPGWIIGIPKIQPGGKIRLIIPSPYGYQDIAHTGIPANSILDFDIELLNVNEL